MYAYGHGPHTPVKHEITETSRVNNALLIDELLEKELGKIKVELENWGYIGKYATQVYGKKNWVCPIHHCIHSSNNWVASQPHSKKKIFNQVLENGKRKRVEWTDLFPDGELYCFHKCKASCKHKNINVQRITLNGPLLF